MHLCNTKELCTSMHVWLVRLHPGGRRRVPYSRDSRSDAAEESKMQFGDFQTKVILHLAVLLLIVSFKKFTFLPWSDAASQNKEFCQ